MRQRGGESARRTSRNRVSLAQDGEGLGTVWGEEKALQMLDDAGFTNAKVEQVPYDPVNNFYAVTKG